MASQLAGGNSAQERPTSVRYGVLFFLCTLALVLYIDRVCIGQAAKPIGEELSLSKDDMSWVMMAFTLAYCLFEVPTGHWGDRFGSRGVIARIVLWWSAFTALTGAAPGFWSLVTVRFLFGAGEAGAFPNAARVVTHWFPPAERGLARGAITTTSLVGAALSFPISNYLIESVGWRWTFGAFGLVGVVWAAAFYWWFRDNPGEHPAVNAGERQLIGAIHGPRDGHHPHPAIPWAKVAVSANVWLLGAIMTVSATLFYMQFQWYSTYLQEARGQTETRAAWYTGVVIAGGAAGCIVGGVLSDLIVRHSHERKWTRRPCGGGALLISALSLAAVRYAPTAAAATMLNAAALFFLQVSIPTWWTVVAEISGQHGAAMWGLMNSLAGGGILITTRWIGWLVTARERTDLPPIECWRPVFDGVAAGLACGAVCWLFVDATRSIVDPANTSPTRERGKSN
jgi:ACS family glucarate transporter-like MFS transporter